MHKFFANTLIFGKNLEYLTDCHSTNDEMLERIKFGGIAEGHIIHTDFQRKGRGQRGNQWESHRGKNLLFTLFLKPSFLPLNHQHFLTFFAAVAIREVISYLVPKCLVEIKWPNDIMIDKKKAAGILTESSISQGIFEWTMLGMGINVNQTDYQYPHATSLRIAGMRIFDRLSLLEEIAEKLEKYYLMLRSGQITTIRNSYEANLMSRNEVRQFNAQGEIFEGEIVGVDEKGWLKVKTKNKIRLFNFKEIQFIR